MKGITLIFLVMLASILMASFWNYPAVKNTVHLILDPTAGSLLNLNPVFGMFIIVFIINLVMILVQKYGTDQATLRDMKEKQKLMREEMKKYKNNPEKLLEFNKKQFENMPKMFELTMKPLIYTFVPLILFFRWFNDFFTTNLANFKFFGFLSWFWFYLIFSIVFSSIFRKVLKVV